MSEASSRLLLRYAITALVIGSITTVMVLGPSTLDASVNYLGPLMMLAVALVSWFFLTHGQVKITILILAYGVCAAVTGIAAVTGGVRSSVVVVYPVIILIFGWLAHTRAVINLSLLISSVTLTFWLAELAGVLPPAATQPSAIYLLHQIIIYALSAFFVFSVLKAYNHHLRELKKVSAELAEYTSLLEQNTDLLERAQAVARVGSWVSDIPADQITPSPEGCQILGIPAGTQISYRDYMQRVYPPDRAELAEAWQHALQHGELDREHRITVQGAIHWIRQKAELEFDANGRPISGMGIVQDITERKLAQLALHESETRYRTLIEWTPEAILVHRMGHILYANPAAIKLFGAPDAQSLLGKQTSELIHPDAREAQTARMHRIYQGEAQPPMVESKFVKLDGSVIDVEVQGTAIEFDGEPAIHVSVRDITQRKQLEDDIRQLAFYDALTQLPNRRLLSDRMQQAMSANRRSGCYSALMFLDLDNFKPLNDTYGHSVGDVLLVEAATRLKKCVREMDTVARFGGDEFVVLLTELDIDLGPSHHHAKAIANKIKNALSKPYVLHIQNKTGQSTQIEHACSASIGVVVYRGADANPDELTKWADAAMYQAKKDGRDRISFSNHPSPQDAPDPA